MPKGLLGWLQSGRAREEDDVREADRLSPAPGASPGVTVHAASAAAELGAGAGRGGVARRGPCEPAAGRDGRAWAAIALSGEAAGDVFLAAGGALELPAGLAALLDGAMAA